MGIKRTIGYSFIKPLVTEGLSANTIIRTLAKQGLSYRREDMLADIRTETGRHKNAYQVERLTGNRVIPTNYMQDTDLRRAYKYRVYGEVHKYDFDTGDELITEGSFYTDDLTRKDEWENQFIETYRGSDRYPNQEVMSFHIYGVDHNEGFGY